MVAADCKGEEEAEHPAGARPGDERGETMRPSETEIRDQIEIANRVEIESQNQPDIDHAVTVRETLEWVLSKTQVDPPMMDY